MPVFGKILSFGSVEQWIIDTCVKWFPEYLAAVERDLGEAPKTFAPLRDWGVANDFDKWPEEHLPFLLVMYSGLSEQPTRQGDGTWNAVALFTASVIVSSNTKQNVRHNQHAYGAALKTLLSVKRDLGHPEHIGGLKWIDERPAAIPPDGTRSLGAVTCYFTVDIKAIFTDKGTTPEDEPRPDPYVPPTPTGIFTKAFPVVINEEPSS